MPGIFGIIFKHPRLDSELLQDTEKIHESMKRSMGYEPFYHTRTYANPKAGVFAGCTSIETSSPNNFIDHDADGLLVYLSGQPSYSENGIPSRFATSLGQNLHDRIIDAYLRVDIDFVKYLHGSFCGILIDVNKRQSVIFNDRMGRERLFYYEDESRIAFASEAKAILSGFPETRKFDASGLAQYVACGATFDGRSLYENIRILPGGSLIAISNDNPVHETVYFAPSEWEKLPAVSEKEFEEDFASALLETLSDYISSYPTSALSLTGGLDSRMIIASLNKLGAKVPCYTFGSMYRQTYDVSIARKIAQTSNLKHHILVADSTFLSLFDDLLKRAVYISDGYIGFSGATELYLNALARKIAPVRITGNYGGETLRNARLLNFSIPKWSILDHSLIDEMKEAAESFSEYRKMHPLSFVLFVQAPSGYGRYSIERSQAIILSPFLAPKPTRLLYQRPDNYGLNKDISNHVIELYAPELLKIPTDRGNLGSGSPLHKKIRRIVHETTFKLDTHLGRYMPSYLSPLSCIGFSLFLDELFKGCHKFEHFRTWMKGELSPSLEKMMSEISDSCLGNYFDLYEVQKDIRNHINGKGNYTTEIDVVLSLMIIEKTLFQKQFIEESPTVF